MNRRIVGCTALLLVIAAAAAYAKKQKPSQAADQQKRALHAIDRLTFGPRPGDVQAVMAMGVDKWIDLQLHPDKIDNSAMQARLAEYRTLAMSSHDMVLAFPPEPIAKAVMDGKLPMPSDPYRRAIYIAAVDRVEQKQEQKQNDANAPAQRRRRMCSLRISPQKQAARQEAHSVVDDLIPLPPSQRMQRILALPVAEQHDLLQGIPYPKRQALLAGLSPEQRETVVALNHPEAVIDGELQSAKLLRAVYSDRQLEEVLTDFWFNHFNVFIGKGADRYLVTAYERDVIRPHVLGKFQGPADRDRAEPGDAVLSRQLAERGAELRCGAGPTRSVRRDARRMALARMYPHRTCAAASAQNQQKRTQRSERELRARTDGAAHARRQRRLHAAGCHRGRARLHRLDAGPAAAGRRLHLPAAAA